MKKRTRRIVLSLAAFFLGLSTLSQIINFDSLKPQIESAATKALEESVHINGHVKIGMMGLRPAAILYDVSLGKNIQAERVKLAPIYSRISSGLMVQLKSLHIGGYEVGDYVLPVHLVKDGFEAIELESDIEGGDLTGDIAYVGDDFHIDLVLRDLPFRRLLEEAEGKVDGQARLDGKGADITQALHTLRGRLLLTSGSGRLTSKSLNFWSRGLMQILLPLKRDETKLNCAVADFNVKDGVAISKALIIDTNEISIFGRGNINFYKQTVNILLTPKPKSMELMSLATPVHLTGPLSNVMVVPEAGGMAKKVGGFLLGVVNPTLMILPLLEETTKRDYGGACIKVLEEQAKPL